MRRKRAYVEDGDDADDVEDVEHDVEEDVEGEEDEEVEDYDDVEEDDDAVDEEDDDDEQDYEDEAEVDDDEDFIAWLDEDPDSLLLDPDPRCPQLADFVQDAQRRRDHKEGFMAFLEGTLRLSSHVSKLRGHEAVHMLIRAALKPKNLFKNLLADDWDFEGVIDAVAHPEALVGKRIRWNRYEDLRADYDPDVGPPGARISMIIPFRSCRNVQMCWDWDMGVSGPGFPCVGCFRNVAKRRFRLMLVAEGAHMNRLEDGIADDDEHSPWDQDDVNATISAAASMPEFFWTSGFEGDLHEGDSTYYNVLRCTSCGRFALVDGIDDIECDQSANDAASSMARIMPTIYA